MLYPFLEEKRCFPNHKDYLNKDELYHTLFKESGNNEFDVLIIQALEHVFHAILVIVERQAFDHLPGGIHHCPSEKQ